MFICVCCFAHVFCVVLLTFPLVSPMSCCLECANAFALRVIPVYQPLEELYFREITHTFHIDYKVQQRAKIETFWLVDCCKIQA